MNIIIGIIVAVLLAGGVSVAAGFSTPGQALYGMKVGVNEQMRVGLALSAAAKGKVHADLAEERLRESEKVVVDGDLRADVRSQIEQNFTEHADQTRLLINDLAETDLVAAADLAANLETSLEAHERILAQLKAGEAGDAEKTEVEKLETKVTTEARAAQKQRTDLEAKIGAAVDVKAAAEGRIGAAENKITEVRRFIDNGADRLGAAATAEARAKLDVADKTLVDAKAKLAAGAYKEAFMLASQAHGAAQDAQLVAASHLDLKVEIRPEGNEVENENSNANINGNTNDNTSDDASVNVNADVNVNVRVNP